MNAPSPSAALISVSLLAAWLGAAGFVSAVITPAAFAVLPSRALAGALVGRALPVLFVLGIFCGVAVAVMHQSEQAERAVTRGATVLALANAAALLVAIRLRVIVAALGAPIDTLAPADPRRLAFGHMHGVSVLLLGVGLVSACVALVVLARRVNSLISAPR